MLLFLIFLIFFFFFSIFLFFFFFFFSTWTLFFSSSFSSSSSLPSTFIFINSNQLSIFCSVQPIGLQSNCSLWSILFCHPFKKYLILFYPSSSSSPPLLLLLFPIVQPPIDLQFFLNQNGHHFQKTSQESECFCKYPFSFSFVCFIPLFHAQLAGFMLPEVTYDEFLRSGARASCLCLWTPVGFKPITILSSPKWSGLYLSLSLLKPFNSLPFFSTLLGWRWLHLAANIKFPRGVPLLTPPPLFFHSSPSSVNLYTLIHIF